MSKRSQLRNASDPLARVRKTLERTEAEATSHRNARRLSESTRLPSRARRDTPDSTARSDMDEMVQLTKER